MFEFISESLKAEIFWNAMSAIGTFTAVLTALFLPAFREYRKKSRIEKLLNIEIEDCMKEVSSSEKNDGIPPSQATALRIAFLSRMNTEAWETNKNYLLSSDPKRYFPYRNIYKVINNIKKITSTKNPPQDITLVIDSDVNKLKEMHTEMFKNKKQHQKTYSAQST
ncbi:MAG: hypothetical protein J7D61_02860 [Marichromatium sp.]|nr:hypothetical protein [Marichromatium sp.]